MSQHVSTYLMTKQFNNVNEQELMVEEEAPEDEADEENKQTKAQLALKNGEVHEKLLKIQDSLVNELEKKKTSKKFNNRPKALKEWEMDTIREADAD